MLIGLESGISTFTFHHEYSFYVNIEQLEDHQLILDIPLCSELDSNNVTSLYM
jgi:hypothetical protein